MKVLDDNAHKHVEHKEADEKKKRDEVEADAIRCSSPEATQGNIGISLLFYCNIA